MGPALKRITRGAIAVAGFLLVLAVLILAPLILLARALHHLGQSVRRGLARALGRETP